MEKTEEVERIERAVEHLRNAGLTARGRHDKVVAWWDDDGGVAHTQIEWMQENGFRVLAVDFDNRQIHFEVDF